MQVPKEIFMHDDETEDCRVGGKEMWKAYGDVLRRSIRKNPQNLHDYLRRSNEVHHSDPETPEAFLRRHQFTEEEIPGILAQANTSA
jgi:hypothetical protein